MFCWQAASLPLRHLWHPAQLSTSVSRLVLSWLLFCPHCHVLVLYRMLCICLFSHPCWSPGPGYQSLVIPAEGEFIPPKVNKILPLPLQTSYRLLDSLLCRGGWPQAHNPPASAYWVQGLQVCPVMSGTCYLHSFSCVCMYQLKAFNVYVWSNHISLVCH